MALEQHVRRGVAALTLVAASVAIAACDSSQAEEKDAFYTSDEYEKNKPEPEPPPDPCRAEGGEPRECRSAEDCCDGYTCGLDPERSRIVRYCLEG